MSVRIDRLSLTMAEVTTIVEEQGVTCHKLHAWDPQPQNCVLSLGLLKHWDHTICTVAIKKNSCIVYVNPQVSLCLPDTAV